MKSIFIIFFLSAVSAIAYAQPGGFTSSGDLAVSNGGFHGPSPSGASVAQAKTLRDDAWVVLEGKIIRQAGSELYEFQDNSGSVLVDIDDKRWMGQVVTPDDKVRLEGEIDKDWNSVEVDVKKVTILK